MSLPMAGEIDALATLQRQRRYAAHLIAVGYAAIILPP